MYEPFDPAQDLPDELKEEDAEDLEETMVFCVFFFQFVLQVLCRTN